MSYSTYTPACGTVLPDYNCDNCGGIGEAAGIGSSAYINLNYLATILADPSDSAAWATGIANKQIILLPKIKGSFDGGTPVMGTGYGRQKERVIGYDFVSNYKDPNYKTNPGFYNTIKNTSNWAYAYVSETQVHVTDVAVTVKPKAPIADDVSGEVVWEVEVTWSQPDIPVPNDKPEGTFDNCIAYGS